MEKLITSEKIEQWIQEVQQRPDSAALIIQQIASRLSELSEQNETLQAENIALQSGERVSAYEQRITHLEYQIDLLKRRFGDELPDLNLASVVPEVQEADTLNLLLYDSDGRVARLEVDPSGLTGGLNLGQVRGGLPADPGILRLEIVTGREELLFIFTSGRIVTLPVEEIASLLPDPEGRGFDWEMTPQPCEPNSGEQLACIAPITRLALADYFMQTSRKGYVKKIRTAMGESILANRYIGTGVKGSPDQTFSLVLSQEADRLALVSAEGFLQCLQVNDLPPIVEQALRLEPTDHLVSAFVPLEGRPIAVMTQVGKVIHWTEDRLEPATSFRRKGQALYSNKRREQGIRVLAASSLAETSWGLAVHSSGLISIHNANAILRSGTLETQGELLAFCFYNVGTDFHTPD